MNTFLAELSKKLAERWLSLLVLPGLLFLGTAWVATTLGHLAALNHGTALTKAAEQAQALHGKPVQVGALVVAVLLGAAAVGLLANALATPVERLWLGRWKVPFRPAPTEPRTWIGKRMALLDQRIGAQYFGLRISLVWPRLWLLLEEDLRKAVGTLQERIGSTCTLAGWGLLYLLLGLVWWPAALVGIAVLATAWRRGREAVHGYASLVEAVVDVRQTDLAAALGVDLPQGVITAAEAAKINERLDKGLPPLPP
ncbi:hypothetical protein [Streptomyces sp. NPDC050546]|uniref:hypothetical protein n=1 Tax=Streptomyces sp. NPDC050546 TaxID=3365628 RepID=UPI0037B33723